MNRMNEQIQNMKENIEKERTASALFETRFQHLEVKQNMKVGSDKMEDQVEKSSAMIGGFGEKSIEEAKGMLKELLAHLDKFHNVNLVEGNRGGLGLVPFDDPSHAMKFVQSQKKYVGIRHVGLWVAENRSRAERNRSRIVSKLECFSLSLGTSTRRT